MTDQAIFGAGCFWGVELALSDMPGVTHTEAGYAGGFFVDPLYEDVCAGGTGHAEVVRVEFDPTRISYQELLEVFWSIHDPTQRDRQGPDVGRQYRSLIACNSPEQRHLAEDSRAAAQNCFSAPIATEIVTEAPFYPAEPYHQGYLRRRGVMAR